MFFSDLTKQPTLANMNTLTRKSPYLLIFFATMLLLSGCRAAGCGCPMY